MKKITIILVAMFSSIYSSYAGLHKDKVPDNVLKAFSAQYPQVAVERWKMMNNTYVATFREDKRLDFAYYSTSGTWIKTDKKLPWEKDLPRTVNDGFDKTKYRSWYIDFIANRESPREKNIYVIQVSQDCGPEGSIPGDCEKICKLYFDANGALLREKRFK